MIPQSAIVAVLAVTVVAVAATHLRNRSREGFAAAPAEEVHAAAMALFTAQPDAKYSDYKTHVPGADPVQFADVRALWRAGRLTLPAVRLVA